jgi:F-type H+-transporting ATPase subunit a
VRFLDTILALQDGHAPAQDAASVSQHLTSGAATAPVEHVVKGGEVFTHLYHHVLAEPVKVMTVPKGSFLAGFAHAKPDGTYELPILFNLQLFQIGCIAVLGLAFLWALQGLKSGRPNRVQRTLTGFVLWVRDEMAVPILGQHLAHAMLPFFLTLFFFIASSNVIGLFPYGATSTGCIFVTAGLAIVTFLTMIVGGMIANGPVKFWTGLVPHGVPAFIWPLMFVVEIIGLLVKPFSLTIRLFANMTGGHLVVLSFMGLIYYFGDMIGGWAYLVAGPAIAFAVFIMIIEALVALLQAYIFTLLSMIFIGSCLHPEH